MSSHGCPTYASSDTYTGRPSASSRGRCSWCVPACRRPFGRVAPKAVVPPQRGPVPEKAVPRETAVVQRALLVPDHQLELNDELKGDRKSLFRLLRGLAGGSGGGSNT